MIPNSQKLVSDFLRQRVETRVVSKPPPEEERDEAWVMVTLLDAPQSASDPSDRLVEYMFQLDCYAGATGGGPEAERISRKVRDVLNEMPGRYDAPTALDDPVVVTAVRFTGHRSMPDTSPTFEAARDRFIVDASVYAHSEVRA